MSKSIHIHLIPFSALNFVNVTMQSTYESQAEDIIYNFLEQTAWRNNLKDCVLTFNKRISIIQTRWNKAVEMEKCKKNILLKIWIRETKIMQMNAFKSKDKKVKKLGSEIQMIRDDVRDAIIDNYLWRCSLRHSLAFF